MPCKNCGDTGVCETESYQRLVTCWVCLGLTPKIDDFRSFWYLPQSQQEDMIGSFFSSSNGASLFFPIKMASSDENRGEKIALIKVLNPVCNLSTAFTVSIASPTYDGRRIKVYGKNLYKYYEVVVKYLLSEAGWIERTFNCIFTTINQKLNDTKFDNAKIDLISTNF